MQNQIHDNINHIEDPTIRVTTLQCWATPENDPFGDLQHYLIEEGCGIQGRFRSNIMSVN